MNLRPHAIEILNGKSIIAIEHDLLDQLTAWVIEESQTDVARQIGISTPYLNDILHQRRRISNAVAKKIGWTRMVVFVRSAMVDGD